MSAPLFYRHCGGEVIAGSRSVLTADDAEALYALHRDEAHAAQTAGFEQKASTAQALSLQLWQALRTRACWRRAAGWVG